MGEQRAKTSQQLFQQATAAFARRQYAEALVLLERGAAGGDAEARNLLGVMLSNGIGTASDLGRAAVLFDAAAASGLREARYNLANLKLHGLGAPCDEQGAQEQLLASARDGHRPALRSLGFIYNAAGPEGRWPALALQCFRRAAEAGDPLAQYACGLSLLLGEGIPADPATAAQWFAAAARAGVYLAPLRLTQAQQKAGGRPPVPAAPTDMELEPCELPALPGVESSRNVAFMSEHRAALDAHLEDHLINVAAPQLMPSGVVDPATGAAMQSELRTSHSMHFQPSMYDTAVYLALRRIANIAGLPASHAEPLG